MMTDSEPGIDPQVAERRALAWLGQRLVLERVENPQDLALYAFDPDEEWLFYVHEPDIARVGASRYVSVSRVTGWVREHSCGE